MWKKFEQNLSVFDSSTTQMVFSIYLAKRDQNSMLYLALSQDKGHKKSEKITTHHKGDS
jgi:hypothetical protein